MVPTLAAKKLGIPPRTATTWANALIAGDTLTNHAKPILSRDLPPEISAEELWARAEIQNDRKIVEASTIHNFQAVFTENLPIAISFASDQHISLDNTVSLRQMRKDAELIASTPGMSCICVGDAVDNHIKHRAAILNSTSKPSQQFKLLTWYLQILREKLIVLISGNHDDWTTALAGVDILKMLADAQQIMYAPDEARVDVQLPGHTYKIAARHQYRFNSSLNQTHAIKQWFRNGPEPFDIGALAHLHELALEPVMLHGLERWVCRPGSYQITSSYSRQLGFNMTTPSCPTFVLYPDHREIIGFTHLPAAARFLTYERQRYAKDQAASISVPRSLRCAQKARRVSPAGASQKRSSGKLQKRK